mmetsp:Transcript_11153/g.21938  ORF Transcript_11153/g.21938 Transcript_11153/m.21938 type:complete len:165 (+) Transcript_11153:89-583(+)
MYSSSYSYYSYYYYYHSVFGGFVRDVVIRGVCHFNADADAHVPEDADMDAVQGAFKEWCSHSGCEWKSFKCKHPSKSIASMNMLTPDGELLEVQLIKKKHMEAVDPIPDFDMNTLELQTDGTVTVTRRFANMMEFDLDATSIIRNLLRHPCTNHPPTERRGQHQ